MIVDSNRFESWGRLVGALLVCSLWSWMAVRTTSCLRVISKGTIPYRKSTIWLIKVLALIVGAGGVAGALVDSGAPLLLAIIPAGIIVFFSVTESVAAVVPPKPLQDPSVYQSAWREYWRLRRAYNHSALGFAGALLVILLISFFGGRLPQFVQIALLTVSLACLVGSTVAMSFNQWKWVHWPCPRCGCSFGGAWARLRPPKHCVYCGMPQEEENANPIPSLPS